MKNTFRNTTFALILLSFAGISGTLAQTPQLRTTNNQARAVLSRIQTKTATLQRYVDRNAQYSSTTNADERVSDNLIALTNSVTSLRSSTYSRDVDVTVDVNDVLDRATSINRILSRSGTDSRISTQWVSIRTDINTLAGYYSMSWDWNQRPGNTGGYNNGGYNNGGPPVPQFPANDRRVRIILDRVASRTATFQREVQRNRYPWDNNTADERLANQVTAFANTVGSLRTSVNSHTDSSDDLTGVLSRASSINMLLDRNRTSVSSNLRSQWNSIRTDVNTLAGYYNTSWNWNEPYDSGENTGGIPTGGYTNRLTGTYRLNTSLSDDVGAVIDRSMGSYNTDQRDNARRSLERRLQSPEMIAIEKNGRTVSMASSNRPQITFDADGVARTETNARGRVITTTVTSTNNDLNINYSGDQTDDFRVTFTADRNGRLKVTREIYLENRREKVSVSSVYDRTSDVAQFTNVYTGPAGGNTGGGTNGNGDFYIANGVSLTATLRNPVSTRASQIGDRFTMDVTSPSQYRGAVLEGRVEQAANSGRINGRASVSLVFDTLTVNGRRYTFAGIIESVTAANGDSVTVNNEGTIRDSNQGTTTAARAGIGALLGAVIGAIAGGGQGAAIGAGVGAGAGAGSVLITGRDTIELGAGSTFRITATGPATVGYNR